MKKIFAFTATLIMLLSLFACGAKDENDSHEISDRNEYVYENVKFLIPADFTFKEEENYSFSYPPSYPADGDNIVFSSIEASSASEFSKEILDEGYKNTMKGYEPGDDYRVVDTDGCETVIYTYKIDLNGAPMSQTLFMIFFEDKTVTVAFSRATGKYDEIFDEIINSVSVIKD